MRIVVLDGHTLNPGDLSWEGLRELGEVILHARSSKEEILARLAGADAALTNKAPIGAEALRAAPTLRYIGVTATGYNIVDVAAARAAGVAVANVPAYGTASVAQATFALLLELANRAGRHAETVREGRWARCPDFCYWDYPLVELSGRKMGIVGYGRIGSEVGNIARAFGMRVAAWQRARRVLPEGVEGMPLEALLRECDVVSLHCPLTEETRGLINRERLSLMKPSAYLLNTSRGPLIDEPALAEALRAEWIAGAGLDVLSVEPPPQDHPLFQTPNCLITPHMAWATQAARRRLLDATVENLRAWMAGAPRNLVS